MAKQKDAPDDCAFTSIEWICDGLFDLRVSVDPADGAIMVTDHSGNQTVVRRQHVPAFRKMIEEAAKQLDGFDFD